MNFDQFIKKLPNLRRATPADNEKILTFMQQTGAQRRFTLFYDRSPDFFSLLNLSSPEHFVLYYEGKSGQMEGVISYTLIKSKRYDILYVGDFKIKASAEDTKVRWRAFANEFIENVNEMEEFKNVKYIYMVMMDDNTKGYQRLVASNILSFKYKKVQSYKMINVIGQKWWKSSGEHFTHSFTPGTLDNMSKLLTESAKNKFGTDHPDTIAYRADKMKDMATILEVKDDNGELLLEASMEDVAQAKRIQIKKLPLSLKLTSMTLPLMKGKMYSQGSPMDILYLSNVTFHCEKVKHSAVLSYAIKAALEFSAKRFHMVSISMFETENYLIPEIEKHFLTQIEPLGYYQIIPTWGEEIPRDQIPNFNMSYI